MNIIKKFYNLFWYITTQFIGFSYVGNKSIIMSPIDITNPKSIRLGNRVIVGKFGWLMGGGGDSEDNKVTLDIGDNVHIGNFSHIISKYSVKIKDNVLIADKVFISDCCHSYKDINVPILNQPVVKTNEVVVGEDSHIGENVCVLGASIGKHCVIGANAVVTHDIPDYSVACGIPAKVIKKLL